MPDATFTLKLRFFVRDGTAACESRVETIRRVLNESCDRTTWTVRNVNQSTCFLIDGGMHTDQDIGAVAEAVLGRFNDGAWQTLAEATDFSNIFIGVFGIVSQTGMFIDIGAMPMCAARKICLTFDMYAGDE